MLEILQVVQTLAIVAILAVFVYFLAMLKKEMERLSKEIENVKKELLPLVNEVKDSLENVNKIMAAVGRGAESAATIMDKFKNSVSSIEKVCLDLKSGYEKTKGKVSVLKFGIQAGVGSLLGYYLNKRRK